MLVIVSRIPAYNLPSERLQSGTYFGSANYRFGRLAPPAR